MVDNTPREVFNLHNLSYFTYTISVDYFHLSIYINHVQKVFMYIVPFESLALVSRQRKKLSSFS